MKERKIINLGDILYDYMPNEEDDDNIYRLKCILLNQIEEYERNIIIHYAESKSIRETAKLLNISPSLLCKEIKKIRNKILDIYYDDRFNTYSSNLCYGD